MRCAVNVVKSRPIVARGSLAAWEREQRARLAVAEEEGELRRMREEVIQLRAELAALQAEREALDRSVKSARALLQGMQESRTYRILRRLGRWESVERGMRGVLA